MRILNRTSVTACLLLSGAVTADVASAAPSAQLRPNGTLLITGTAARDVIALRVQSARPNRLQIDFGDNGSADVAFRRNVFDRIRVRARGGRDRVRIDDSQVQFTTQDPARIEGQGGRDRLTGGAGDERLEAGRGRDAVDGGGGDDVALLGDEDDTFVWDPGDGSDVVEGEADRDTLRFNGSDSGERFAIAPNGPRIRFTRDVGNVAMDVDGVEQIDAAALGGADSLTVDDTLGTALAEVNADLAGTLGGTTDDGRDDTVNVNTTEGDDVALVTGAAGSATVIGTDPLVAIAHADAADDELAVHMQGGEDVLDASGMAADAIALRSQGGPQDDVLIGSDGADTLLGAADDDVLIGGPAVDVLDGGPGNNIVIQD